MEYTILIILLIIIVIFIILAFVIIFSSPEKNNYNSLGMDIRNRINNRMHNENMNIYNNHNIGNNRIINMNSIDGNYYYPEKKKKTGCSFIMICFFILLISFIVIGITSGFFVRYYCFENDTYNEKTGVCEHTEITNALYNSYKCNNSSYNERLEGNKCVYELRVPASIKYTCPFGYNGSSICSKTYYDPYTKTNKIVMANSVKSYYCISGTLIGTDCVTNYSYDATPIYYCNNGGDLAGNLCIKNETYVPIQKFGFPFEI